MPGRIACGFSAMLLLAGCGDGGGQGSAAADVTAGASASINTSSDTGVADNSAASADAADNSIDSAYSTNMVDSDDDSDGNANGIDAYAAARVDSVGGGPVAYNTPGFTHLTGNTVALNGTTYYKSSTKDPDYGLRTNSTNTVLRFEIHSGDPGFGGDAGKRDRHELVTRRDRSQPDKIYPAGTDIWLSFAMLIQTGDPITADHVVVGQLHNLPSSTVPASPPFYFQVRALNSAQVTYSVLTRGTNDPNAILTTKANVRWSKTLSRGKWIRMVAHVRASSTGTGQLELWADGTKVLDLANQTIGYPDPESDLYWQFGLYRPLESNVLAGRFANMEAGRTNLFARVADPLPIPAGE